MLLFAAASGGGDMIILILAAVIVGLAYAGRSALERLIEGVLEILFRQSGGAKAAENDIEYRRLADRFQYAASPLDTLLTLPASSAQQGSDQTKDA